MEEFNRVKPSWGHMSKLEIANYFFGFRLVV
jgi:hypothetical protein